MGKYRTYTGTDSSYATLHQWVRNHKVKPLACEDCGRTDKRLDWANISKKYKKDINDYRALCKQCHFKLDGISGTCKRGHKMTEENSYYYPNPSTGRVCRICKKAYNAKYWLASQNARRAA